MAAYTHLSLEERISLLINPPSLRLHTSQVPLNPFNRINQVNRGLHCVPLRSLRTDCWSYIQDPS